MLRLLLRLLGLVLATALALGAQESDDVRRDEAYGFELHRRAAEWSWRAGEQDSEAKRHLQLALEGPAGLRARVGVWAARSPGGPDAAAQREAYRTALAKDDSVSDVKDVTAVIDGEECLGLILTVAYGGRDYRARYAFCVYDDRLYVLEHLYDASAFYELSPQVEAIWNEFEFLEVARDESAELLRQLAERCGSEVDFAASWPEAAERAKAEGKRVLVFVHLLPGFEIEDPWLSGPLMKREIVALVNQRYVPLRYRRGLGAPFERQEVYGMSGTTFGSAVLVVDPEGRVLSDARADLDHALRAELATRPRGRERRRPPKKSDAVALARWLVDGGEFERARKRLRGDPSAAAALLEAEMCRRSFDVEGWEDALLRAETAPDAAIHAARTTLERAGQQVARGEVAAAATALVALVDSRPGTPEALEARFWLGGLAFAEKDTRGAREAWESLCVEAPESRWAWLAAAKLRSTAFEAETGADLRLPTPEALAALRPAESEPVAPRRARRTHAAALAALLRLQRDDGAWICTGEATNDLHDDEPDNLSQAVSALATRALLPHLEEGATRAAASSGLDQVLGQLERDLALEAPIRFMDYTVWNRASQVRLLADCLAAEFGNRERVERALEAALRDLRARQHPTGGGWSYFVSGSLEGSDNPMTQSISFTTAWVVLALAEAQAAGATMPEGLVEESVACLERMRDGEDAFVYMLHHGNEGQGRGTKAPSSAGRMPLCVLALLKHGKADLDELRHALDLFTTYRAGLSWQVGRALMHAGPYAEGSHWVLFDYATAAEALRELPVKERGKHRVPLLELLLEARRADDTFLDNPLIGRDFGTAMAVRALEDLGAAR